MIVTATTTTVLDDLRGNEQPRLFTPPLRELTDETSKGFAAIRFAEGVLGWALHPWQKWLLIHGLELLEDGTFRFRTVVVLVARQNGKTYLSQILALFALFGLGVKMVVGTSVDLDTAREVWDGCQEAIDTTPVLSALAATPVLKNGAETIRLNKKALPGRYKIRATGKGRGLSADLLMLDELREHRNWRAWSAITKTMMARPKAQAWCFSNAGGAESVVLRYLRLKAHERLGDPDGIVASTNPASLLAAAEREAQNDRSTDEPDDLDDDDLDPDALAATGQMTMAEQLAAAAGDAMGLFEWSAAPTRDVWDTDGWCEANPSLGYGDLTGRAIAASAADDPEWEFRTEVLCQWADGALHGVFKTGTWEATRAEVSRTAPDARRVLALDVAWDRSRAHVALVGEREDGLLHGGIIASRPGTDWVVRYLAGDSGDPLPEYDAVVVQERGAPVSSLIEDLQRAGVPVIPWSGSAVTAAFGQMYDLLAMKDSPFRHMDQPVLDVAVQAAVVKLLGDAKVIDRKASPVDAAPLIAVMAALWAHRNAIPAPSAYEDHDLLVM